MNAPAVYSEMSSERAPESQLLQYATHSYFGRRQGRIHVWWQDVSYTINSTVVRDHHG